METLVIATSNPGKLDEFKEMFKDVPVTLKCLADYPPLPAPNENGRTFAANAKIKSTYYARNLKEYCLADDSGLEVKALEGAPGVEKVTGMGMMAGVKPVKPAEDVVKKCIEKGVLCLTAKDKVRLLPALNMPEELLVKAVEVIKEACAE